MRLVRIYNDPDGDSHFEDLELGEVRRFGPGEPVLVEDTDGKGHITRNIGGRPRRTLVAAPATEGEDDRD